MYEPIFNMNLSPYINVAHHDEIDIDMRPTGFLYIKKKKENRRSSSNNCMYYEKVLHCKSDIFYFSDKKTSQEKTMMRSLYHLERFASGIFQSCMIFFIW